MPCLGPSSFPARRRNALRPDGAVEVRQVPAGELDLLDVLAGNRRVYQIAAAHIYADVRVAGEAENVAWMEVAGRERTRRGVQRDPGKRRHLVVADPGDGDPRVPPRRHRQARAVIASVAWPSSAVHVGAVQLVLGEGNRLLGLRR